LSFQTNVNDSRRTAATKPNASFLPYVSNNKTNNLLRQKQNKKTVFSYWHFIMATCSVFSLDHFQANVRA